jgi:RNA polymerase sigma factor (TIGR02999 family)
LTDEPGEEDGNLVQNGPEKFSGAAPTSVASSGVEVVFELSGRIIDWPQGRLRKLISHVDGILDDGIPVTFRRIEEGSTLLRLRMTAAQAERLRWAIERGEFVADGIERIRAIEGARRPSITSGEELTDEVYGHLRAIAQRQTAQEPAGRLLTATALVNEAYLKLAPAGMAFEDRASFYHAAAQAMRRVLIDNARRRGARKPGRAKASLADIQNVADLAREDQLDNVLALEEAYALLEKEDAEAASVVRLRFYAGLTGDQTAEVLGISARQADRAWAFGRAFLASHARGDRAEGSSE